jgi:hypothetical protein
MLWDVAPIASVLFGFQLLILKQKIPHLKQVIIGIIPKPSVIGFLPRIELAKPTPNAVTSGTVMVLVVTPPES